MPRKRHIVRDPAELAAVVSPLRHHLLRTLSNLGPSSIRQLAQDLGRSAESLYYHVRALVEVGLIVEHGPQARNGRTEMHYRTVAEELVTDPTQTTPAYLAAYRRSVSALLRLTERQVSAAIERQEDAGTRRPISLRAQQLQVRLSVDSQRELARRLDELLAFVAEQDDPAQSTRVAVTLVSAPLEERRSE